MILDLFSLKRRHCSEVAQLQGRSETSSVAQRVPVFVGSPAKAEGLLHLLGFGNNARELLEQAACCDTGPSSS